MTQHSFDFDDAMSVQEFFDSNKVKSKNQLFKIKTCYPYLRDEDNEVITDDEDNPVKDLDNPFPAVGFTNGDTTENGNPAYTFFVLSRNLEKQGYVLNEDFLFEHHEDLQLLEPVDDLKFGICFLKGEGGKSWADFIKG